MNSNASSAICAATCWGIGLLSGVLIAILLVAMGGWMIMQGVFIGAIAFMVSGGGLFWLFCRTLPGPATSAADAKAPATPQTRSHPENTEPAAQPAPGAAPAAIPVAMTAPANTSETMPEPAPMAPDAGTKPAGLSGARGGTPDDLKKIKGVGPKLEQQLHSLGYYHFDQVANWTPAEITWVDENLQGFKGRVSRDNWVEQATLLAAGGETEFPKKVGKGAIY